MVDIKVMEELQFPEISILNLEQMFQAGNIVLGDDRLEL